MIEVNVGDTVVEFPDGTHPDVMKTALQKQFPKPTGQMADLGNSIKGGLIEGAAGLAGFPSAVGDLVQWGEKKILGEDDQKYSARLAERKKNALLPDFLPTTEQAQAGIEKVTGPAEPSQTTTGKYARTAASFIPGALLGPGNVARNVGVYGIGAGLASEGAGQAAQGTGYEAPARIAGALAAPLGVAGARRAITPLPANAQRQAANAVMEGEGVNLTAGQRTGSMGLKYAESESGGPAQTAVERQKEQFTSAVLRRAGENANRATPDVINGAFNRLGHEFDGLAARNNLHGDAGTVRDLTRVWREYTGLVSETMRAPIVENALQDITAGFRNQAGVMDGAAYSALRSRLGRIARETKDPQLENALVGINRALDNTMERSIARTNPGDLGAFRETRRQYRNLIPIAKAAEGAGEFGLLTPEKMRQTTVSAHGGRNYARGQGDLAEVVRAGNDTMKALPQSGTTPRYIAQATLAAPGAVLGAGQGHEYGGAAGSGLGTVLGALGGRYVAGRTLMSRPMQGYLGNQLIGAPAASSLEQLIRGVPSTAIGNDRFRLPDQSQ